MSKITYTDKEYIYENAEIPEINKTTDGNMNEIKTVVNENDTRLTTAEAVIGNETDTYSASSTYALGSLVIYNSLLYKCTTAITVAESWNSAKWTQTSLTSEVNEIKIGTIIEEGTTEDGYYAKYDGGLAICVKQKTFGSVAITTSAGGMYMSNVLDMGNLPIEFLEIYYNNSELVSGQLHYTFWKISSPISVSTAKYCQVALGSNQSKTPTSVVFQCLAIGRWK